MPTIRTTEPRPAPHRTTDRGASATEYALLIAGIAAVIAALVFIFGGHVSDMFHNSCNEVANQTHQGTC
jgi:pilus assembly protein Flp/PilA